MAKQRYRPNYDNLTYDNSSIPYAPAPVKEILALTAKKEQDYLETKDAINLNKSLMKTMPYDESSKGVYDEMVSTVDNALSSITPDNYSDNTLNTKQIAHDAMNEYGGIELAKQKQDFDSKAAAVAAFDIRPEKKAYKMAQMRANTKGITKDENGKFVVEPVPMPKLVPEIDVKEKLDTFLKDWKANKLYEYNPDGTINVSNELRGYLGITKIENITETELREGAMAFMALDPKIQEYLDDEADFMTKGQGMSVEDLAKALTPAEKEMLVPNKKAKDITAEDIRLATEGKDGFLQQIGNHVLKKNIKDSYIKGYSDLAAKKWSYEEQEKEYKVDEEYSAMVKARYATKTTPEVAPPLVIAQTLTTLQELSPTSMTQLDENIDIASKNAGNLLQKLKGFQKLKDEDKDGKGFQYQTEIDKATKDIQDNDIAIQQAQEQKRNITETIFEIGRNSGLNIDAEYAKQYPEIVKETDRINIGRMMTKGYTIPYDSDVMAAVKRGGGLQPGIFDKDDTLKIAAAERLSQDYVVKDGDNYTYVGVPTASALRGSNGKATEIYNSSAKAKLQFKDKESYFKNPATKEQYREAVAQSYMNEDYDSSKEDFVVNYSANKTAKGLRKIAGDQPLKINKTFDYLDVSDKAGPKTAAFRLNELTRSLKENVLKNAAGYKVYDQSNNLVDLNVYLTELGIDMSDQYINTAAFKPNILLTADRKEGQQLDLSLPLTDKGKEIVREKLGADFFTNSKDLVLVGVNSTGKSGSFNAQLSDAVRATYMESFGNLSVGGEETRKQLGLIAFNNSGEESKRFYDLNLYSLAPDTNVKYETPDGHSIRINSIRRTPNPTKMSDNDFFITDASESSTFGVFTDNNGQTTTGLIKNNIIKDSSKGSFKRQTFSSPEDIAGFLGKSMLNNQMYNMSAQAQQQAQVQSTGVSYNVQPGNVKATNYQSSVNNALKNYGKTAKNVLLNDASGSEKPFNVIVPRSALADLRDYIPNNLDKQANLPYVNSRIVDKVASVVQNYGLTLTSALRDSDKNKGTEGAAENSLHMYGYSTDATYDANAEKFMQFAQSNPTQLASMGINFVYKHVIKGVPHLHIDYNV